MNASVPSPRQESRFGLSKQNEQRANEPSMEEILASIRRIIADDQSLPRAFPVRAEPAVHPVAPAEPTALSAPEVVEAEPWDAPQAATAVVAVAAPPAAETSLADEVTKEAELSDVLLSPAASESVAHAFDTLDRTLKMQNDGTLEDMSRELLRPMLKAWLDENLPALVERLVKAEIERVVRGGR